MEIIMQEKPVLVYSLKENAGVGSLYRILKHANAPDDLFRALAHSVVDEEGVWCWDEWEILERVYWQLEEEGLVVDAEVVAKVEEALKRKDELQSMWENNQYEGELMDIREEVEDVADDVKDAASKMFVSPYAAADALEHSAREFKTLAARIRGLFPVS